MELASTSPIWLKLVAYLKGHRGIKVMATIRRGPAATCLEDLGDLEFDATSFDFS